jgi:hypothetical protein
MCKQSTFQIDAAVRLVAHRQLGLVTVAQAARSGVDRWALERRREAGLLVQVFAQVMRISSVPPTSEQRILAATLAMPGSAAAGPSAGLVHGMPVGDGGDAPVVTVAASRSTRTSGIVTVRQRVALPSRRWFTAQLATPAATLVLLPRFVAAPTVERCLDHCLAHRLTSVAKVRELIASLPPRSVVGRRQLLDLLDARTTGIGHRSGLEQRVARWLDDAGLRGWRRNFRVAVGGRRRVEVDFAWPDVGVALEVSPFFTHGSRTTQQRDVERRRLLAASRWLTVEATDPDLTGPIAFERCLASLRPLLGRDVGEAAGRRGT